LAILAEGRHPPPHWCPKEGNADAPHAVTPQLFSSAGAFAMGDMVLPRRRNPHTLSKSLAFRILLYLDHGANLVNFLTHCNQIWKPDFRFDL
jgi:hypothetical protein